MTNTEKWIRFKGAKLYLIAVSIPIRFTHPSL